MPTKLKLQLTIPIEIEVKDLHPNDEAAYIAKQMAVPGNCDNDLGVEGNRAWFSRLFRAQVALQQILLTNPTQLARFVRCLALNDLVRSSLVGQAEIEVEDFESVMMPIAQTLDEVEYFFPPPELGVDTYSLIQDVIESMPLLYGQPLATILEQSAEGPLPPPVAITLQGKSIVAH